MLVDINNLSLREVEKFVKYLKIYYEVFDSNINGRNKGNTFIDILGVFISCFKPIFIKELEINQINNISELLGLRKATSRNDNIARSTGINMSYNVGNTSYLIDKTTVKVFIFDKDYYHQILTEFFKDFEYMARYDLISIINNFN